MEEIIQMDKYEYKRLKARDIKYENYESKLEKIWEKKYQKEIDEEVNKRIKEYENHHCLWGSTRAIVIFFIGYFGYMIGSTLIGWLLKTFT